MTALSHLRYSVRYNTSLQIGRRQSGSLFSCRLRSVQKIFDKELCALVCDLCCSDVRQRTHRVDSTWCPHTNRAACRSSGRRNVFTKAVLASEYGSEVAPVQNDTHADLVILTVRTPTNRIQSMPCHDHAWEE